MSHFFKSLLRIALISSILVPATSFALMGNWWESDFAPYYSAPTPVFNVAVSAVNQNINWGSNATIKWDAPNAVSCDFTSGRDPGIATAGRGSSGSATSYPLYADTTFTVSCVNSSNQTAVGSVKVIVAPLAVKSATTPAPTTTTPATGLYIGYMNGSQFIQTANITQVSALENCKLNQSSNPNSKVSCTWNGTSIYPILTTTPVPTAPTISTTALSPTPTQTCKITNIQAVQVPGYVFYNLYIKTNIPATSLMSLSGTNSTWDGTQLNSTNAEYGNLIANQTINSVGINTILAQKNSISLVNNGVTVCQSMSASAPTLIPTATITTNPLTTTVGSGLLVTGTASNITRAYVGITYPDGSSQMSGLLVTNGTWAQNYSAANLTKVGNYPIVVRADATDGKVLTTGTLTVTQSTAVNKLVSVQKTGNSILFTVDRATEGCIVLREENGRFSYRNTQLCAVRSNAGLGQATVEYPNETLTDIALADTFNRFKVCSATNYDICSNVVTMTTAPTPVPVTKTAQFKVLSFDDLALKYDSSNKEALLTTSANIQVIAGDTDIRITKPNFAVSGGTYYFSSTLLPQTGRDINYYGVFSLTSDAVDSGDYYTVPAGKSAIFKTYQEYNPKRMFAGQYGVSMKLASNVFGQNSVALTSSKIVTIVGEDAVTSTVPTVEIIDAPSLSLQYDSRGKESTLVSKMKVRITTGNSAIGLYQMSVPGMLKFYNTNNDTSVYPNSATFTSKKGDNVDGQQGYNLQANSSDTFYIINTAKTGELFAGTYTAMIGSLGYTDSTGQYRTLEAGSFKNYTKSNTVTVIGETSPYISKVDVSNGKVIITGLRLNAVGNMLQIDGIGNSTLSKYSPSSTSVDITSSPLLEVANGTHYVTITNTENGNSNAGWFDYQKSQPTLPAPVINYFNADKTSVGVNEPVYLSWSSSNTFKCQLIDDSIPGTGDWVNVSLTGDQTFRPTKSARYKLACTGKVADSSGQIVENTVSNKISVEVTQASGGTYIGYMNGRQFIQTANITQESALENCKLNQNNNPSSKVNCTWNGSPIYPILPSVRPLCGLFRGGTDTATNMIASPNPETSIGDSDNACINYCDVSGFIAGDMCRRGSNTIKTYPQIASTGQTTLANPTFVSSSPISQFVVGGTTFGIATFKLSTTVAGTQAAVRELHFSTTGTDAIESITIGGVTAPIVAGNAIVSGLNITAISAGTDVPVKVKFAGVQNSTTGGYLQTSIPNVSVALNYVEATTNTGSVITNKQTVSSNNFTLVASKPTVVMSSGNVDTLVLGTLNKVGEFTVAADANGKIALATTSLTVLSIGISNMQLSNPTVRDGNMVIPNSFAFISKDEFDSRNQFISLGFNDPGYVIPAGTSKTFSVYATVSGSPQVSIIPTVRSYLASPNKFTWKDTITNSYQTGERIYNFPTNWFSINGVDTESVKESLTVSFLIKSIKSTVNINELLLIPGQKNAVVGVTVGGVSARKLESEQFYFTGLNIPTTPEGITLPITFLFNTKKGYHPVPEGVTGMAVTLSQVNATDGKGGSCTINQNNSTLGSNVTFNINNDLNVTSQSSYSPSLVPIYICNYYGVDPSVSGSSVSSGIPVVSTGASVIMNGASNLPKTGFVGPVQSPELTFTVNGKLVTLISVQADERVDIAWKTKGMNSCTGSGIGTGWAGPIAINQLQAGSLNSLPSQNFGKLVKTSPTTSYTISCIPSNGRPTITKTINVKVIRPEIKSGIGSSPAVLGDSTTCINIPRNLHRGTESGTVSMLQNFLVEKGYLSEATGFYGDKTVEAVKDYQASKGLPETGKVYTFTRQAMSEETCN